jgi:transposase
MADEKKKMVIGEVSKEEFLERNPQPLAEPRLKRIDREQARFEPLVVEELIEEDHLARAIWEMTGQLDLSGYHGRIRAVEGVAGRERTDPRLLLALWLYAYTQSVSSAREIERLCGHHPAYRWLCGLEAVNYHTLSSFRVENKEVLEGLFVEQLGILSKEGFIDLKEVMHDGTKVLAQAGSRTFRREATLEEHLEMARKMVEELADPEQGEEVSKRKQSARRRAREERLERLKLGQQELAKIRAGKRKAAEKKEARVSETDPEARIMKQGNGGYAPSYNVQVTTDKKEKIIIAVAATQSASDANELMPAVARVEENLGTKPTEVVVDAGFTTRGNIVEMAEQKIGFIGSLNDTKNQVDATYARRGVTEEFRSERFKYIEESNTFICPNEKVLAYKSKDKIPGAMAYTYQAEVKDCEACTFKTQCCPKTKSGRKLVRTVEGPEVVAYREKMETEEAKKSYGKRSEVAEFPNLWIKEKLGLRKFRLRGLTKAGMEATWACLTYNIQQWIRLSWRPKLKAAAGTA